MLEYVTGHDKCRSQVLLAYFGETGSPPCNECDVCREKNESQLKQDEFDMIRDEVLSVLAMGPLTPGLLTEKLAFNREKTLEVIQWMLDNDILHFNEEQQLFLTGHS
jgi:ATP-dependent DNA helicase RecQ